MYVSLQSLRAIARLRNRQYLIVLPHCGGACAIVFQHGSFRHSGSVHTRVKDGDSCANAPLGSYIGDDAGTFLNVWPLALLVSCTGAGGRNTRFKLTSSAY